MAEWVLLPTELDCAEANRHGNDNGGQGGLGTGVPVLVLLGGEAAEAFPDWMSSTLREQDTP